MAVEITDAFAYSNGALQTVSSGDWVRHSNGGITGTAQVVSGVVVTPDAVDLHYRHATASASTDHYAEAECTISGGSDCSGGPIVRVGTNTAQSNGFLGSLGTGGSAQAYRLARLIDGVYTLLGSSTTAATSATLRVEADGDQISLYADDVLVVGPVTDASLSSNTGVGIYSYKFGDAGAPNEIDNFEAGTLGAAVPAAVDDLAATSGDTEVELDWTAPDDGGSAITDYEYRVDGGTWTSISSTTPGFTVTSLTNGVEYDFEVRAVNAIGDAAASNLVSATPAARAWVNRTVVAAPENGTASHTVNFTPATAGNLLVAVCVGPVTHTTPTGWTLEATAVAFAEIDVWSKTATASESSLTTTHNGSNYAVSVVVYEFAAGSTFVDAVAANSGTGQTAIRTSANPNLTGLTGTNLVFGAFGIGGFVGGDGSGASTVWDSPNVEDLDAGVANGTNEGHLASVCYQEAYASSSYQPTPTITGGTIADPAARSSATFAINVASGTAPAAVDDLAATPGDTEVELDWTAPDDGGSAITDYEYRVDGGTWTSISSTTPGFTVTSLTNGVEYDFEVRAVNAEGDADASNLVSATPAAPTPVVPDAPTSVLAVAGDSTVVITWVDETSGIPTPTYEIERKTGAGAYGALTSSITQATETYNDTSAVNDTAYTYRVRATNSQGDSSWVETSEVTPSAPAFGPIATENALPGAPTTTPYLITDDGGSSQGYSEQRSVDVGETIDFAVTGSSTAIKIYRIGHYDGDNWRLIDSISNTATTQPSGTAITDSNGATSYSNWSTTASWAVPSSAVSGFYVAVVRNAADTAPESWIPFIVRDDDRVADIVVQVSDMTWGVAYNWYDGKNFYGSGTGVGSITDRAHARSLDQPINTRGSVVNHWDIYESAGIDWLEANGFDVKYISGVDTDKNPTCLDNAKIWLNIGHDEYWSQGMRDTVEAFRDAGGHLVSWAANDLFWRVRFADSYRTMWCYKDTMPFAGHTAGDALDPVSWTGTWRDTRWGSREPENELLGTTFRLNGINFLDPEVDASEYGASPFWRDTTVESGPTDVTFTDVWGFEANSIDIPDSRRRVSFFQDTINIDGLYANDDGQTYTNNGNLVAGIVMHRNQNTTGVVVHFGAMAWVHALSDYHREGPASTFAQAQQASANLLYDLGAEADTLDAGLTEPTRVSIESYGMVQPETASGGTAVWTGTTPADGADTANYELGTLFTVASGGETLSGVRIWMAGSNTYTSRTLELWDSGGAQVTDSLFPFAIPDALVAGWNEITFPSDYSIAAGDYTISTQFGGANSYGASTDFPQTAGNITIDGGRFNPTPGVYPAVYSPNNGEGSFYGVDILIAGGGGGTAPDPPTSVVATPGDGEVVVTWTDETSGDPTAVYDIERRIGAGVWVLEAAGIADSTETWTDDSAVNGTTYRYRIRATNLEGDSAWVETSDVAPGTVVGLGTTPTDSSDAATGAGSVSTSATGAPTDSSDAATGAGSVSTSATGAPTDAEDVSAGAAGVSTAAAGAVTDQRDSASGVSAASPVSVGTGTPTDAPDVATGEGAGPAPVSASSSVVDSVDSASGSGSVSISASGAPTDERDTLASATSTTTSASGDITDLQDSASGSAGYTSEAAGSASDQSDSASGAGALVSPASGDIVDASDSASGSATSVQVVTASGSPTDQRDTLAAAARNDATGVGAGADSQDEASGSVTVINIVTGSGAAQDQRDLGSGAARPITSAIGSSEDQRDIAAGSGIFITVLAGDITDQGDAAAGVGSCTTPSSGDITDQQDQASGTAIYLAPPSAAVGAATDSPDVVDSSSFLGLIAPNGKPLSIRRIDKVRMIKRRNP